MNQDNNTIKTKKAAILAASGFEELETLVPYDLLRQAGIDAELVAVSDQKNQMMVKGTNGLVIEADALFDDYDFQAADALILPGGDGAFVLEKNPEVIEQIKLFASNPDKILGAICAGSAVAGRTGVYKDKYYTCVPSLNGEFGGHFEAKHCVADGNLVTGISVGGAYEFAFALVERLAGKEARDTLEKQTFWQID